ncbi:MAG: hypothetical protein HOD37_19140 [Bacteroidetes bacterium]|nr:hypothetical protein [Bacteroidota bacterium]MBT4412204.1 hypothetical protein [Bacteroidota bacterium]
MKLPEIILIVFCLSISTLNSYAQSSHSDANIEESLDYLKTHQQSPEQYVINKFIDNDYVIIGEFHRLKQNLELLQNLIPQLYEAEVYQIGWEFGPYEYQGAIDSMLFSDHFDADLIKGSMLEWYPVWSFIEYYDVFRKAWEFNQLLPDGARKFRIVNLNYAPDHKYAGMTKKKRRKYFHKGTTDEHMAKIIMEEFVGKGEKALIYSGIHHSFTKYYQPRTSKGINYGFTMDRMGNFLYDSLPGKVFHIILHYPWRDKYFKEYHLPLQGQIERLMERNGNQAIGFDTKDTPMGLFSDDSLCYYASGYENFTLHTMTDGYIFQVPICEYENTHLDVPWVEANWKSIKEKQDPITKLAFFGGKKKFMKVMLRDMKSVHRFPCPDRKK